tara:strand:- start:9702 stop:10187 length:486 start_codon:yes stop_codon:yes gene_type:complete
MDPLTITAAVGIASKAFETIKAGFSIGRDLESMTGDLGRWMGAVSDVDNAEKQAKNPPLFKKLMYASSIEQTALEAFAAKKKLAQQRQELKTFLNYTFGPNAYNELLQMEGKIRKDRQKLIYERQQLKDKIISVVGIILISCLVLSLIIFVVYRLKLKYGW